MRFWNIKQKRGAQYSFVYRYTWGLRVKTHQRHYMYALPLIKTLYPLISISLGPEKRTDMTEKLTGRKARIQTKLTGRL